MVEKEKFFNFEVVGVAPDIVEKIKHVADEEGLSYETKVYNDEKDITLSDSEKKMVDVTVKKILENKGINIEEIDYDVMDKSEYCRFLNSVEKHVDWFLEKYGEECDCDFIDFDNDGLQICRYCGKVKEED